MPKHRKDPSKIGLSSPEIEGQGTTETESGNYKKDSKRLKKKRM